MPFAKLKVIRASLQTLVFGLYAKTKAFSLPCLRKARRYLDPRGFDPHQRRHFVASLACGLAIALVMQWFEHTTPGQMMINGQYDAFIRGEAFGGPPAGGDSPEIVFIDIDHDTYKAWKRPEITPRDVIAKLIDIAYRDGAAVIAVDIAFERPDRSPAEALPPGTRALDGAARDAALEEVLASIRENPGATKVILATELYNDGTLRPSRFRKFVDRKAIFEASPVFYASGYDKVVRFWAPYYRYKDSTGERRGVLWTMPVLATVLAAGDSGQLAAETAALRLLSDDSDAGKPRRLKITVGQQNREIDYYTGEGIPHQYNRIRFAYLPPPAEKRATDTVYIGLKNVRYLWDGIDRIIPNKTLSLQGKIVIIGNSSPDFRDHHDTPVGPMPGMYLHGNIVHTLIQGRQTGLLHPWWQFASEILITIIAAYLFLHCPSSIARKRVALGALLLLPVSYWWFRHTGVFYGMVLPLAGIALKELLVDLIMKKIHGQQKPVTTDMEA